MLAFESSLALGLTPDNPCPTGEVNRVVKGVTIYRYPSSVA
jgi:tagatose-6-phosphate ketose/aldose isomerase